MDYVSSLVLLWCLADYERSVKGQNEQIELSVLEEVDI
jgi:hypothetical protein